MKEKTIRKAWDICEAEKLEQFNACRISPAVFEPKREDDFVFQKKRNGNDELWDSIQNMNNVTFMMEPLDGYLRCNVYVATDECRGEISFKSYNNRIKIGPHDTESSFKVFKYFINEFESNVCELEFLGGLDQMETS